MSEVTPGSAPEQGGAPKNRKRLYVTLGIVAVILVIAVVGGLAWHETPGFCNAICHSPMDSYVKGYQSTDETLLITKHSEGSAKLSCLDCHEPTMDQQLKEATSWVSGDFSSKLETRKFATKEFCFECHSEEKIIAATVDFGGKKGFNPHDSRHGEMPCYNCHSMHDKSSLFCNNCHNVPAPKGWVAPTTKGEAIL